MATTHTGRLVPLDWLRGLAVAGMILVTSPGSWDHAWRQLQHAPWDGWTLADMVFPTFLFSVGFALALGFRGSVPGVWGRVMRRTLLLILLGLLLNALPYFDLPHLRIPGILQRIALCYALAASLLLLTARSGTDGKTELNRTAVAIAVLVLLVGYWLLLMLIPVPGIGAGHVDSANNLPAFVDRTIFSVDHLWPYGLTAGVVTYDPEGLLSTLPATVNVLIGILAAGLWRRGTSTAWLALAGVLLFVAGLALDPLFPINKRIWTSSFALLSSGFSLTLLAVLMLLPASRAIDTLTTPFRILGGNAILAFVLSQLLSAFGGLPILAGGRTPQNWGYGIATSIIPDANLASFACALAILTLVVLLVAPLHRRRIHLRL